MECNCEILNVTQGTDISLKVTLTRGGEAFPVELSEQVAVAMVSERGERVAVDFTVGDEGRLLVTLRSDDFRTGRYGLEVVGVLNGAKWRAFGQSVVRYTFETVKGAERVAVQGDEYDVTLDVGLVSDIVPRKTSELLNDGADGEHPFVSEDELAAVATSGSYNDLKDKPLLNYIPTSQKGAKGGVAELNGDGKIPVAQAQFALRGNLVAADIDSTALQSGFYRIIGQRLGADILGGDEANGVLIQYSDGYKEQVLHVGRTAGAAAGEQVETYTRRYLPTPKRWTAWSKGGGGEPVIYDVIYDEDYNRYYTETECSDEYKQYKKLNIPVFFRIVSGSCPADANKLISLCSNDVYFFLSDEQYGTFLYDWVFLRLTYALVGNSRIYLMGMDIKQILPIRFSKNSSTVSLNWRDETITSFTDANTTYKAMTQAQAEAGAATTGLLISPKVLADYIRDRIRSSISQYYLIELNKIGENQYEVDDPGVVEEAIEGLNNRDVLKCQVEVKLPSGHIFSLVSFMDEILWFSYASAEESVIYEVQISRNPVTGGYFCDYFIRVIPSE